MQRLVVIGTSLGGMTALRVLFQGLTPNFPVPIAVVQHRHRGSDHSLANFLQSTTRLKIKEVEDKDEVISGYIYLAPADYHLLVEAGYFVLSTDEPVSFARPSIDVLFESAADAYAAGTLGVILTGANQDGAVGAAAIKACGGQVIVQEPAEAESAVMPTAAIARTAVDWILPLHKIVEHLNQWSVKA